MSNARARISIIGLGLIGASLGLAIRKERPQLEVVGHDANAEATKQALKLGAIEKSEWNLLNACESADLIIFALPALAIKQTFEIFQKKNAEFKRGLIITDTAGSKAQVMQWAEKMLPEGVHFVGGDPMVGPFGAQTKPSADLFKGATYCLSPLPATPPEVVQRVQGLVELLGAQTYFIDPAEHDGYAALTDHLPFVLSTTLLQMAAAPLKDKDQPVRAKASIHRMIGGTFRRAVDLSSEDPQTLRDLCLTNRESILRWVDELRDGLDDFETRVKEGDEKKLGEWFEHMYTMRKVVQRPFVDAEAESQSDAIRGTSGFGIGDLFGFRGRRAPDKNDKKK